MKTAATLTTTAAAALASVAPSTIKRWADEGVLPSWRTPGGHRRFKRIDVERVLREQSSSEAKDPVTQDWTECLIEAKRHKIESRLLEANARLGSWARVCDEVSGALVEIGSLWSSGQLAVSQEHLATEALLRCLGRISDAMPRQIGGPVCLLACPGEEQHTLGLALAELCLNEAGWSNLRLGARTPIEDIRRLIVDGSVTAVAVSATMASDDEATEMAVQLDEVCFVSSAHLVLGGAANWPDDLRTGVHVRSFAEFHNVVSRSREKGW